MKHIFRVTMIVTMPDDPEEKDNSAEAKRQDLLHDIGREALYDTTDLQVEFVAEEP